MKNKTSGNKEILKKNAKIISFVNQKGGVGKTTTAVNMAHAIARMGFKVLIIDMDPQFNASMILGKMTPYEQSMTIVDLFTSEVTSSDCIAPSKYNNLDFISSHMDLFALKNQIFGTPDGMVGLKNKIDQRTLKKYDYIFIDCPPDVGGPLVTNALVVSDKYIIPVGAEDIFGLRGMHQLESSIQTIRKTLNPKLLLLGVLLTMADKRSNATEVITDTLNTQKKESQIFKTVIRRNAAVNSAFISNKSVLKHDSRTPGAKDYEALAKEFIIKMES